MLENIEINCHSSIKISKGKTIYIDPFKIEKESHDADIILITHDHYDHYSPEDIEKIEKQETIIVSPKTVKALSKMRNVILVEPNNIYEAQGVRIETIASYNINKKFHPKENEWVGYIIEIQGIRYYIAGDTDITPENKQVKCDIAFIPVGGTYTMTAEEGAELANIIKPKIAIPTHYGSVVGNSEDGETFKKLINQDIECKILIK
ncbi:MAG: MBL fold metallo-hydrolase [Clostridia bacterium]|nr:MBL fold metallo-hydrolase [Clostridia bacterium]